MYGQEFAEPEQVEEQDPYEGEHTDNLEYQDEVEAQAKAEAMHEPIAEDVSETKAEYPILECRMNGRTLQAIVNHVCTLADEAKVSITSEGWRINIVDAAHIAMVDIVVTMQSFET